VINSNLTGLKNLSRINKKKPMILENVPNPNPNGLHLGKKLSLYRLSLME
jgi:hypothetical protein